MLDKCDVKGVYFFLYAVIQGVQDFKIFRTLFSLGVSVCTHTSAAAELAEFRKITKF